MPRAGDLREIQKLWPGPVMAPKSVHSAKGLEGDFVFVADVRAGAYAFPSEIEDDPLIDLVLAEADPFEHAEERRIFYVALTRARRKVILVVNPNDLSPFAK